MILVGWEESCSIFFTVVTIDNNSLRGFYKLTNDSFIDLSLLIDRWKSVSIHLIYIMFHDPKTLFFRLMQRLTTLKDKKKSKVTRHCMNITTLETNLGNINHSEFNVNKYFSSYQIKCFKKYYLDIFLGAVPCKNNTRNESNRFRCIQQDSL